ncbi:hypothetical protein Btru_044455 [Bulinus truncatus]|nr:hypothetical protein Btru_044455 [Bulinus truncatus]
MLVFMFYVIVVSSGLQVSAVSVCGSDHNDPLLIDLSEPTIPGPFHDLTTEEIIALHKYLEEDPSIHVSKSNDVSLNQSFVNSVDLYIANKQEVLRFLNGIGDQPSRLARAMVFRGDLSPPVIEEYICGPLPDITSCDLLKQKYRRNPVQFSLRPYNKLEFDTIYIIFWKQIQQKVGYILQESYNLTLESSPWEAGGLTSEYFPFGTGLHGDINERKVWLPFTFDLPFYGIHPIDFSVLISNTSPNLDDWRIEQVWYAGRTYASLDELDVSYRIKQIPKVKVTKPTNTNELFASLQRRGEPVPRHPQRPPLSVDPDGKRYTVKNRQVKYMDWSFNFRMSSFTGPSLYDVRFQNERIAYEISLAEISVFYSGSSPLPQTTNYVDSASFVGLHSRALVPGGDCPQSATLINQTFMSTYQDDPDLVDAAFCLFELNTGTPLSRQKFSDALDGHVYEGLMDTSLTLRAALTIDNYDYIVDFIFHQNGVMETRFLSTGYILPSFFREADRQYGFRIAENIIGNVHHHMAQFKVDLDILGTQNRFETVEVVSQETQDIKNMLRLRRTLKQTETEAVYDYDLRPEFLLVHNDKNRTKSNGIKGYRIALSGASKQYLPDSQGNEQAITWARHQLVVTKHKDEEFSSSSNYAMFDGADPVVDFSNFYLDDDNIVDEDVVVWLTCGMHHIPHTEDLPVTPAVGNHLSFFLLPHNYFPSDPATQSRDSVKFKFTESKSHGGDVRIDRRGNKLDQCLTPPTTLEEDVKKNPDLVLQSIRMGYSEG